MNTLIQDLGSSFSTVVLIVLAVVIFAVVWKALQDWGYFEGAMVPIMAVAVTLLCLMGMHNALTGEAPPPAETEPTPSRDWGIYLLPYVALGLTIPAVLVLLALWRLWVRAKSGLHRRRPRQEERFNRRHDEVSRWSE